MKTAKVQPAAQGSWFFLLRSWEWNFCPLDWSCSKKQRTKADLRSDPQRNKWQAPLCYSCAVLKEHLKRLGFAAQHLLFLLFFVSLLPGFFWGVGDLFELRHVAVPPPPKTAVAGWDTKM